MKRQEILKRRIRARAVQKITQSEKGDKNRFFCGEKRLFLSNYARNWQWIMSFKDSMVNDDDERDDKIAGGY